MRRWRALLLGVLLAGCFGTNPSLELEPWLPSRPLDLASLATRTRELGGVVFVGEVEGREPTSPGHVPVAGGPDFAFTRETLDVRVIDPLGEPLGPLVVLLAPTALPVAPGYRTVALTERWNRRFAPSGPAVYFAVPEGIAWRLEWSAGVFGDEVDPRGTVREAPVGLEHLRRRPRTAVASGSLVPPVRDLLSLAAETRGAGGFVLLASVSETAALSSVVAPDGPRPELRLAYPMLSGTLTIEDPLGASLPSSQLAVVGPAGPPVLVDSAGIESEDWYVSGVADEIWRRRILPEAGRYLMFLQPSDAGLMVRWAAPLVGDDLSGDGTTDGGRIALDEVRLP